MQRQTVRRGIVGRMYAPDRVHRLARRRSLTSSTCRCLKPKQNFGWEATPTLYLFRRDIWHKSRQTKNGIQRTISAVLLGIYVTGLSSTKRARYPKKGSLSPSMGIVSSLNQGKKLISPVR